MRPWKIFYGDGSTFSSEDGPPSEAPPFNVQAIAQAADIVIGRKVVSGKDYYWWENTADGGEWFGSTDPAALWDYLARHCPSIVKFSRILPRLEFEAILNRAVTDSSLTEKTAWASDERKGIGRED